jgi:hypothetical protein
MLPLRKPYRFVSTLLAIKLRSAMYKKPEQEGGHETLLGIDRVQAAPLDARGRSGAVIVIA